MSSKAISPETLPLTNTMLLAMELSWDLYHVDFLVNNSLIYWGANWWIALDELIFSRTEQIFVERQAFTRSLSWLLLVWGKCWCKLFSNTWWCMSVGLPLNFSWPDVNINWFNGRCWAIMFIILTDVIAKNYGRSYCQFLGRCYCPYIWGGNISFVW